MQINFNIASVVVYSIFIYFLWFALTKESNDINCRDSKGKICGKDMGRAYVHGKLDESDDINTLLKKLKMTSRYEINSILWRRCFIVAIISSIILIFVLKNRMPTGIELTAGFLIIYIVMYMTLTYFQQKISKPALKQLDELVEKIKSTSQNNHT